MAEIAQDLEPWERPPEEAYWQALLNEGEYGEGLGEAIAPEAAVEPLRETTPTEESVVTSVAEPKPLSMGQISNCWKVFAEHQEQDKAVELLVTSYNRGGLLVNWDDVTGFVPASQLCSSIPYDDEEHRRDALAQLVGTTLELKIIELDPTESRLILSERATNRIEEPDLSLLDELTPGDIRHGRVTNLCAFGAFVDLGGLEGLIHISELSWGRVAHPSDVLEGGQEVDVYVLKVDREQSRVGLSLKRLKPDPWNTVEDRYQIGQIVEGLVTNVVKFGAFVRIEDGLEGLIHASEFPGDIGIPSHYVQEGDAVQVRIMSIEGNRHRIGLSLL